jgi:D-alanine-D-alanine ligase
MNLGLVYDLRADWLARGFGEEETAEFDRGSTLEALEAALGELGHEVERVGGLFELTARLVGGARWDLVFNIAEGMFGFGREAQVPALLDAYRLPYTFADPLCAALTLHKGMTKRVLRDLGIPTAPFAVVERAEQARDVELPYPLFAKPIAEGTAKGVQPSSRAETPAALEARCAELIARFRQPVLVETFLPGREVTVGIVGTGSRAEALGTLEVVLRPGAEAHAYTYENKERCEELCDFPRIEGPLAKEAEALALAAWQGLGCRDGGRIDLRADADGRLCVLEANPLPGLHPSHSDLPMLCTAVGIPYRELIRRIVASASQRIAR